MCSFLRVCVCVYTTPPNTVPTRLVPTQSLHLSFQPSPYNAPSNPIPTPLLRALSLQHSPNPPPTPLLPTQSPHDSSQPSPYTSPSNPVPTPLLLTQSLYLSSEHRRYSTLATHSLPFLPTQSLHQFSHVNGSTLKFDLIINCISSVPYTFPGHVS